MILIITMINYYNYHSNEGLLREVWFLTKRSAKPLYVDPVGRPFSLAEGPIIIVILLLITNMLIIIIVIFSV